MKLKVVRIFVNNAPDQFGVWPDDGKPSFGRKPLKTFENEDKAKEFIKVFKDVKTAKKFAFGVEA